MPKKGTVKGIFVLNKMTYAIRFILDVDENGVTTYQRIRGKSELGPFTMSKEVYERNLQNPNIQLHK